MNNNIQVLETREVFDREFTIYGTKDKPLFLSKDIAEWIEHSDSNKMIKSIDEDEKLIGTMFLAGQNREMWFLTEHGLYEILFRSNKPIAKTFKKEVKYILEQLRKTGMATVRGREAEGIELYFSDFPDEIKKVMAISLADKNERIQSELRQVKEQLAVNAPKVEAFDEFIDRKDTYSFNDVSKLLGIQQNKLLAYLESVGLITKFKKPSSRAVTKGIAVQKITDWGKQTRITPVGIDYIRKNYKNYLERNIVK